MRICTDCKGLTDYVDCPKCGMPTEEVAIHSDTEELFEVPDVDKARSILNKLRKDYTDACDDVTKAEKKVRQTIVERDYAGQTLIRFWELITTPQEEPIEIEQLMLPAIASPATEVNEETGEIEELEDIEEIHT